MMVKECCLGVTPFGPWIKFVVLSTKCQLVVSRKGGAVGYYYLRDVRENYATHTSSSVGCYYNYCYCNYYKPCLAEFATTLLRLNEFWCVLHFIRPPSVFEVVQVKF
jgi:hypothetical protein